MPVLLEIEDGRGGGETNKKKKKNNKRFENNLKKKKKIDVMTVSHLDARSLNKSDNTSERDRLKALVDDRIDCFKRTRDIKVRPMCYSLTAV